MNDRPPGGLWVVALGLVVLHVAGACASTVPSVAPTPTGARPALQIDESWNVADGRWTFTGRVDPAGDPTDVVLEIGPGPESARRFDAQVPVGQDLVDAGPLTVTTADIPDIDEICVRFAASNRSGTSVSSPFCFPHDIATPPPPGAPVVHIFEDWTAAGGEWTFSGRVEAKGDPTDVVLEVGRGPASAPTFDTQIPVSQDLTEAVGLTFSTAEIPDADEICVRFTATNSIGASSSAPLCFAPGGPGPSAP